MQQSMSRETQSSRRGVKRTVTILVALVLFFFALSFLQILLMK